MFLIFNPMIILLMSWEKNPAFGSRYYPLFLGFVFAQFGLLAIWFSFSAVRWWIRLPITILTALGFFYLISWTNETHFLNRGEHDTYFGLSFVASIIIGGILRPFIGTIRRKTDQGEHRRAQITILTMMGWVTAVAALAAFLKARWGLYIQASASTNYCLISLGAFATNVFVGYFLFSRRPIIASIVALVLSWAVGMILLYVIHGPARYTQEYIWHFGMVHFSQCVMMLTTVAAARMAGYRATSRIDQNLVGRNVA